MARANGRRAAAATTACSLLLALALTAWAPAHADAAVDVSTCTLADCCWRGKGSRERYCACRGRISSGGIEPAGCGNVGCGLSPPADVCDPRTPPPADQAPTKTPEITPPLGGGGGRRAGPGGSKGGCACTLEYAPVCAAGKTYPTACAARCDGRTTFKQGACSPQEGGVLIGSGGGSP